MINGDKPKIHDVLVIEMTRQFAKRGSCQILRNLRNGDQPVLTFQGFDERLKVLWDVVQGLPADFLQAISFLNVAFKILTFFPRFGSKSVYDPIGIDLEKLFQTLGKGHVSIQLEKRVQVEIYPTLGDHIRFFKKLFKWEGNHVQSLCKHSILMRKPIGRLGWSLLLKLFS